MSVCILKEPNPIKVKFEMQISEVMIHHLNRTLHSEKLDHTSLIFITPLPLFLTPSRCMLSPRQQRNNHWLQPMLSERCHRIFNLQASLILFCPHLSQLEGSVEVFTMLSHHTLQLNMLVFWPMTFDQP